jgi:N-methylhydantoinase A/oxoprolinase/acetone carboxylase beta subunit
MEMAIEALSAMRVEGFSIVSCFGSLYPQHEHEALLCLHDILGPDIPVTLSSEMGGIGFLERENATLLNTALKKVIGKSFASLEVICGQLGLRHARLALVQNDGSQMTMEEAKAKPILTLSCGPMNSAKGGSLLSGKHSCVVVDIGGTSTDAASVHDGYVKRSGGVVTLADVRMKFPSPDVVSLALGGGSVVFEDGTVGPQSVARELFKKAQAFGGSTLTLTDLALLLELVQIDGADVSCVKASVSFARDVFARQVEKLAQVIRLVRGERTDLPCILVGGGAALFQKILVNSVEGIVLLQNPTLTGVANAFGAAQSEISGNFDAVVSLRDRQASLFTAEQAARTEAIRKGANPKHLRIGHVMTEPLAYSHEKLARVTVCVIGPA